MADGSTTITKLSPRRQQLVPRHVHRPSRQSRIVEPKVLIFFGTDYHYGVSHIFMPVAQKSCAYEQNNWLTSAENSQ